mgnify:CR=1 FL=1
MIIATGNNFGCGAIEIKDYQSEKVVVLNAKITFDPRNEASFANKVLLTL